MTKHCDHHECRPGYVDVRAFLASSAAVMRAAMRLSGGADNDDELRAATAELVDRHLLLPALTTWALIAGEVGVPRLPGGVPLSSEDGTPLEPAVIGGVGGQQLADEPWARGLVMMLRAAGARDGAGMYAARDAVVDAETDRPHDESNVVSFIASAAAAAGVAGMVADLAPERLAALHAIGAYACTRDSYAGACVAYRLASAVLTAMSTPALVDVGSQVIGPEAAALATLPDVELVDTAIGLATFIADHAEVAPSARDPYDWRDADADARRSPSAQGRAYAMRLIEVCRDRDKAGAVGVLTTLERPGIAMAAFGLSNLVATWARDAYADNAPR